VNQIAESPPSHFAAQLDIDQLLPLVIGKCREALDAEGVSVLLLADQRQLDLPAKIVDVEHGAGKAAACPG
jgi:hypothetical protein